MGAAIVRQPDLFPAAQPGPDAILARALEFNPCAIYVGVSGGDDSLATAHWMMSNVPGCKVLHINTGIGIARTRQHVRDLCRDYQWPLTELRAKEDAGQDYDKIVIENGFPGPAMHGRMYQRLKERCVRIVVAREKALLPAKGRQRRKVMIATGIRYDESVRRMGYGGREVNFVGSQMWVNPLYWQSQEWFSDYIRHHQLPRNPVSQMLGMSGECLCGAFASKGEKAMVRLVCPETADRLDALEAKVRAAGHPWGWEDRPPRVAPIRDAGTADLFRPMCLGCEKAA